MILFGVSLTSILCRISYIAGFRNVQNAFMKIYWLIDLDPYSALLEFPFDWVV